MKSHEIGNNAGLELSSAKLRRWATIAALGVVFLLTSCGVTQANSNPLQGEGVVHAMSAESWDVSGFHYGPNSGEFDARPSSGGILESSLVKPSTLCDGDATSSLIEICNSIETIANVMGMSDTERVDIRGRIFIVDVPTMESLYPTNATGVAIPEYQSGQIVGKGIVVFPDYVQHDVSALAHEWGHIIKNEGQVQLNLSGQSTTQVLGNENIQEDLSCVRVVDEAATVCKQVEPGRSSCTTSSITELRADIFSIMVAGGDGEYSGYLWEQPDSSAQITRAEAASLIQTMRMYYTTYPTEFKAWVKM